MLSHLRNDLLVRHNNYEYAIKAGASSSLQELSVEEFEQVVVGSALARTETPVSLVKPWLGLLLSLFSDCLA